MRRLAVLLLAGPMATVADLLVYINNENPLFMTPLTNRSNNYATITVTVDERVEDLLPTLAQVSFKDASHVGDPPTTGAVVPSQARLSKSPFQGTRMTQKRQMAINGLVKTTFSELNQIFQLPSDLSITWDKKLRSTAGTTLNKWTEEGVRTSTIQLNPRVIGSEEKLMETLAHELCHAAAWQFDGVSKPPHGQAFKKWRIVSGRLFLSLR
jgi:hypothetical protein